MNYTWMVAGMAAVTIFIKAVIFMLGDRVVFPALLKEALSFVPVTVLTAIVVPLVLAPHGNDMELTCRNPQLVGSIAAIIACAMTRRQLLTMIVGLGVFFGWQLGVLG